jgi:DNA repair protein RadC
MKTKATNKSKEYSLCIKAKNSSFENVQIINSSLSASYARNFFKDDIEIYESVFIMLLSKSNHTIGWVKISQGGTSSTVIDVKIVAKYAIDCLASAVVLVHNHPSGNLMASEADKEITQKVKKALELLDVRLLDHIILTKNSYYSLDDNNLM